MKKQKLSVKDFGLESIFLKDATFDIYKASYIYIILSIIL